MGHRYENWEWILAICVVEHFKEACDPIRMGRPSRGGYQIAIDMCIVESFGRFNISSAAESDFG